jgi:Fe-S-cluster-containing hydrogenase component 2
MKTDTPSKFSVERDSARCIVNQCSSDVHYYDTADEEVKSREQNCVAFHCCVVFCPTGALTIKKNPPDDRENHNWRPEVIKNTIKQSETGGALLTGMGSDKEVHILGNKFVKLFPHYLRPYGGLYAY